MRTAVALAFEDDWSTAKIDYPAIYMVCAKVLAKTAERTMMVAIAERILSGKVSRISNGSWTLWMASRRRGISRSSTRINKCLQGDKEAFIEVFRSRCSVIDLLEAFVLTIG